MHSLLLVWCDGPADHLACHYSVAIEVAKSRLGNQSHINPSSWEGYYKSSSELSQPNLVARCGSPDQWQRPVSKEKICPIH
jgi:hypothetical protein